MIYEHFYPQELKDLVHVLQERGMLDEIGLRRINHFIARHFIVAGLIAFLMISSCLMFYNTLAIIVFGFFAGYISIVAILSVKRNLREYPVLYSLGTKTNGSVTKVFETGIIAYGAHSWGIDYKYLVNGIEYSNTKRNVGNYFLRDRYKAGQNITVYYHPDSPNLSTPYISSLHKLFNIKRKTER